MAEAVEITPRQIYQEDLALTTVPTGDTDSVTVLGAPGPIALNKIPLTLLTQLVSAANDAAAGVAGVTVGDSYYNTATMRLRTRMT
jgi:hypothetical protein